MNSMDSRPCVVLSGSSGSGKTILAQRISRAFGYEYIQAPTRSLEQKHGGRDLINSDRKVRKAFQADVAKTISENLNTKIKNLFSKKEPYIPFVTDRGIDFLMYECVYGGEASETVQKDYVEDLVSSLQMRNVKVYMLTRDDAEMQSPQTWSKPVKHKYYDYHEVLKQEASLVTVFELLEIPYIRVQRHQIEDFIFPQLER